MNYTNHMIHNLRQKVFNREVLVKFVSGSLFNSLTQIIANIIILRIIKPNELGTWNSLIIIQTYALFFEAGVLNGLNRELPFYLGKNEIGKAYELASSSLFFFLFSIVLFIIVSFFFGLIYFNNVSKEWVYTYLAIIIITSSKFYENYLTTTFRSKNSFENLSYVYFIRGIIQLISIPLVLWFHYKGYIIRMIFVSILTTIMLHIIRPIKVVPKYNLRVLIQLMKIGLPIFVLIYIYNSSLTIDRLLFIKNSSVEKLGYYSLGLMALSAFKILPDSLANYLYPRLSYKLGEGKSPLELISISLKSNLAVFSLMMILAILACLMLPHIIEQFFPAYIDGIRAAQILLFSGVFIGGTIGNNVITSMKAWKQLIIIFIVGSLLNVLIIYGFSKYFNDILEGISIGVLISSVLFMALSNLTLMSLKKS
jgi:O-antigen/teichoic acid export membrane protein